MSELHKFIFDGQPVRGMVVRLTDAWQDILRRRAANTATGPYPEPVRALLGEMAAAAVLMQGNIKFNGALELQIMGDGPLKVAVAEVQPDFALRATALLASDVDASASLPQMVNLHGQGRCAITLEPRERQPGQQRYQGVVPLQDAQGRPLARLADVLQHYMRQSEQLDTTLVLAANDAAAAGLLIQRLPAAGQGNLQGQRGAAQAPTHPDDPDASEDYRRIALLAQSLTPDELLTLDVPTILHRLFWQEPLRVFDPLIGQPDQRDAQGSVTQTGSGPRFACTCSRARVAQMVRGLGVQEVQSLIAERGQIEVGCDFCGQQYHFDPVDAAQLFAAAPAAAPAADAPLH